jgi:hypothetical protein
VIIWRGYLKLKIHLQLWSVWRLSIKLIKKLIFQRFMIVFRWKFTTKCVVNPFNNLDPIEADFQKEEWLLVLSQVGIWIMSKQAFMPFKFEGSFLLRVGMTLTMTFTWCWRCWPLINIMAIVWNFPFEAFN